MEAERRQARAKGTAGGGWHATRHWRTPRWTGTGHPDSGGGYVAEMEKAASAGTDREMQAELLEQAAWAKAKICLAGSLVAAKDPSWASAATTGPRARRQFWRPTTPCGAAQAGGNRYRCLLPAPLPAKRCEISISAQPPARNSSARWFTISSLAHSHVSSASNWPLETLHRTFSSETEVLCRPHRRP